MLLSNTYGIDIRYLYTAFKPDRFQWGSSNSLFQEGFHKNGPHHRQRLPDAQDHGRSRNKSPVCSFPDIWRCAASDPAGRWYTSHPTQIKTGIIDGFQRLLHIGFRSPELAEGGRSLWLWFREIHRFLHNPFLLEGLPGLYPLSPSVPGSRILCGIRKHWGWVSFPCIANVRRETFPSSIL